MILKAAVTLTILAAGALAAQRPDTVVRMASKPLHAGVATLKPEVTIGVADGDAHYMLGAIGDIAVGPSGNIYIWDRSVPAIRMYDAAGKYVKTIGAKGSGPGEYRAGAALAFARNGNLLMWDPGNARINVYTPSGGVLASWPTLSGGSGMASGRGLLMVDTAGVGYISTMIVDRQPGKPVVPRVGWIRLRPDGSPKDTVFVPPMPDEKLLTAQSSDGKRMSNRIVPFAPFQFAVMSPLGYLVTGSADRIALDIHEPVKPIASIRRSVVARPVSAKERDSARADVTEEMRTTAPNWSWNGPDIPKTKPVYQELFVGGDGRLWVELEEGPRAKEDSAAANRGDVMFAEGRGRGRGAAPPKIQWSCPAAGVSLFDVYEPTGRYLGQVQIPARVDPIIMRGDFVWATTCNDDDVPSVVRYRILWR